MSYALNHLKPYHQNLLALLCWWLIGITFPKYSYNSAPFEAVYEEKGKIVALLVWWPHSNSNLRYEGGEVYAYSGQDFNYWSYFEACELIKGIDSKFDIGTMKIWWKHDGGDARFMDRVREKMKRNKCGKEVDTSRESSDESMKDMHLEDNEKEKMNDFDEGVDEGRPRGTHVVDGDARSEPLNNVFITRGMDRKYITEEDYMIDELDSGEDDANCDDRPSVIRFNEEVALSKDFTFKAGLEFSSLKQFKNVILKHAYPLKV
ncbi:unnamed protein product [Vicia faba]|uniref:Uncharacterized protein n=1 Tax=Vicia faba TaxID=3906 RepID=A0AAV0Z6K7_VICFA|nr:unnamed protein product [Vicia faba]